MSNNAVKTTVEYEYRVLDVRPDGTTGEELSSGVGSDLDAVIAEALREAERYRDAGLVGVVVERTTRTVVMDVLVE